MNESTGELRPGRCRATNLCDYCARLFAVETSEMLLLDAMEDAPTLYVVLTARELLDRGSCRAHLQHLGRKLRRRWPNVRWAVLVEFQRRGALHLNLLVKGVPAEDREKLHEAVSSLWCSRVDAEPQAQFVGEVNDGAGLVRYVSQHFMKPSQAPPIGWRGHRFSATRGYLVRPASAMREEARRSLRLKRLIHRLDDAEAAELELQLRETDVWSVHHERSLGRDLESALKADARRPFKALERPRPPELAAPVRQSADDRVLSAPSDGSVRNRSRGRPVEATRETGPASASPS